MILRKPNATDHTGESYSENKDHTWSENGFTIINYTLEALFNGHCGKQTASFTFASL